MKPERMTHARAVTSLVLAGALVVTVAGCSSQDGTDSSSSGDASTDASTDATADEQAALEAALAVDATISARDVLESNEEIHSAQQVNETDSVPVDLGSSDLPEGVSRQDGTVTISKEGTYSLSGTLAGQVVINVPDGKVNVILNSVEITSSEGSALAATEIDELTIVLAQGTTNTLIDSATYDETQDPNAALYSAGNTTISGEGQLSVTGNFNDGITSKDGLLITSGDISITAVDDALRGKDYVAIFGGNLDVVAGGDGISSDNDTEEERGFVVAQDGTLTIAAQGDGIAAATDVVMTGGTIAITTGAGASEQPVDDISTKGVKSGVITVLESGSLTIDAQDDALHSDGAIAVAGATVSVSSGDDGVHAEGTFLAAQGSLTMKASYEGIEAYFINISGGTTNVTASDDGLNATGGTSSETQLDAQGGGAPQGEMPDGAQGEKPAGAQGEQQAGGRPDENQGGGGQGGGFGGGMDAAGDYEINISGGTLTVTAQGDGIDSNGSLSITGGETVVHGPTQGGNGSLDVNGEFGIDGGELLTIGTSDMAVTPTAGSQAWIALNSVSLNAGDAIEISDGSGVKVLETSAQLSGQRIFLSSSKVSAGEEYTISINGETAGTVTASSAAQND